MKKLFYFIIFFVWAFILIGHSKSETNNSKLALSNDKLIYPILYIKKIIIKEIENTKKYQNKMWKKEKYKLSGFFSDLPNLEVN